MNWAGLGEDIRTLPSVFLRPVSNDVVMTHIDTVS